MPTGKNGDSARRAGVPAGCRLPGQLPSALLWAPAAPGQQGVAAQFQELSGCSSQPERLEGEMRHLSERNGGTSHGVTPGRAGRPGEARQAPMRDTAYLPP